jgi:hypothetical protein
MKPSNEVLFSRVPPLGGGREVTEDFLETRWS